MESAKLKAQNPDVKKIRQKSMQLGMSFFSSIDFPNSLSLDTSLFIFQRSTRTLRRKENEQGSEKTSPDGKAGNNLYLV